MSLDRGFNQIEKFFSWLQFEARARARSLWYDDQGQAITEYILLLSFAAFTAATLGRNFLKILDNGILNLGGQLERDLKTGKTSLDAWQN